MHPMATAMNAIGYDAAALGNHEFNYGLDLLRAFEEQCDFPLLSANTVDWDTGAPAFPPYIIKTVKVPARPEPVKVGILGLVTPGVAIWDKANVEGKVEVPRHRRAGQGLGAAAQGRRRRHRRRGVPLRRRHLVVLRRRAAVPGERPTLLAQQVPGIDAILVGHAHVEIPERLVTNTTTGKDVLLVRAAEWGMRVAVMDFDLAKVDGRWTVVATPPRRPCSTPTPSPRTPRSPRCSGRRTTRSSPTSTA